MRRVGLALATGILLSALSVSPAFAQASISGLVAGHFRGCPAGRHHRGVEPGSHRAVRTAMTDGAGLFRIFDLRPGTYW